MCWNTVLRNTVPISRIEVSKAFCRARWLSSPAPIKWMAETRIIIRIGRNHRAEKIRRVSCTARCCRRSGKARLRIRCATGRRSLSTSTANARVASNPVTAATLLVMLPPRCRAICGLVRASLQAARKPIRNNGRGATRRMIRTAVRLCPVSNRVIRQRMIEGEKIPLLVA
ncbi:hypothetical protein D3C75_928430 [compost metagenome]